MDVFINTRILASRGFYEAMLFDVPTLWNVNNRPRQVDCVICTVFIILFCSPIEAYFRAEFIPVYHSIENVTKICCPAIMHFGTSMHLTNTPALRHATVQDNTISWGWCTEEQKKYMYIWCILVEYASYSKECQERTLNRHPSVKKQESVACIGNVIAALKHMHKVFN